MKPVKLPASYYQQFDADFTREVPGEGYAGWKNDGNHDAATTKQQRKRMQDNGV